MNLSVDGAVFFVIGTKVQYNRFCREVGNFVNNVECRHLTKATQLRGRLSKDKKLMVVLDDNAAIYSKVADKDYKFVNTDILYKRIEEDKVTAKFRNNALGWYRDNCMGELVEPFETEETA